MLLHGSSIHLDYADTRDERSAKSLLKTKSQRFQRVAVKNYVGHICAALAVRQTRSGVFKPLLSEYCLLKTRKFYKTDETSCWTYSRKWFFFLKNGVVINFQDYELLFVPQMMHNQVIQHAYSTDTFSSQKTAGLSKRNYYIPNNINNPV